MDMADTANRNRLISWARELAEAARHWRGSEAAEGIEDAVEQYRTAEFEIALLGKVKRGKSTLINALLGRADDRVAPVDKLPASSAITRLRWAEQEKATVVFRDGRQEQIGFERILDYVTEEHNRENHKNVSVVEVEGPFPGLDRGTVLVDTPGAGSLHEHHDALLHGYIPRADAVIFLVTTRMPLDQDELDLLQQVKDADIRKVFFAMNRADEADEAELQEAIEHNRRALGQVGISVDRIHRISARNAMRHGAAGSGVEELWAEISRFLAANKGRVLAERFEARVRDLVRPIYHGLEVQLAGVTKSAEELEAELRDLQRKKRSIASERELAEREFRHVWSRALDQLSEDLRSAERRVTAAAEQKVAEASLTSLSSLTRSLPTWLEQQVEKEVAPAAEEFETVAYEASRKLESDYPSVGADASHNIVIRTKQGSETLVNCGGAVAVAGLGGGIVAGSSVAAAAAGTATVATASPITGLVAGVPYVGELLAAATTGTATVGAAAPAWAVFAGPVGWTIAGIGALAIPFAWRISKVKFRDKLEEATREQVEQVFRHLRRERVPSLRKTADAMVEEFRLRLERELERVETALAESRERTPQDADVDRLTRAVHGFRQLLGEPSDAATAGRSSEG